MLFDMQLNFFKYPEFKIWVTVYLISNEEHRAHLPIDHEAFLVPELAPVPEEGRVAHLAAVCRLPRGRHLALDVQLPEDEQAVVSRGHQLLRRGAHVQRLHPPSTQAAESQEEKH